MFSENEIIENVFSEVYSAVRVDGLLTYTFNCPSGVRQNKSGLNMQVKSAFIYLFVERVSW